MRRLGASLALLLAAACTSTSGGSPSPSPSAPASAEPTPGDRVLMEITDECTGLASIGRCKDAEVACNLAFRLYDAAKLPRDDKQRKAAVDAKVLCEKKLEEGSDVHAH